MKIENESQEIEILEDSITIKSSKQENHTIEDLRQKLINNLYDKKSYENEDIEILRILFDDERY